jgi:hypothetical protein
LHLSGHHVFGYSGDKLLLPQWRDSQRVELYRIGHHIYGHLKLERLLLLPQWRNSQREHLHDDIVLCGDRNFELPQW